MVELQVSRERIDAIDKQIVQLFEERQKVTLAVANYKKETGKKVFDPIREAEKLKDLGAIVDNSFNRKAIEELFRQIMSISRKLQFGLLGSSHYQTEFKMTEKLPVNGKTKVIFFGLEGTYTQQAMEEVFGTEIRSSHMSTFKEIMEAIQTKEADYGILPIENSTTGGITDMYDLLTNYDNCIVGEHFLKIEHALLALPDAVMEEIKKVYSHPQPLMQCGEFFEQHKYMKPIEYTSTAHSAKKVWEDRDNKQAAIAGIQIAKQYGLKILKRGINQESKNSTRFIIISKQRVFTEQANKISLSFELPHEKGSLYNMLSHFIFNDLNLTKIESRPIPGRSWEYRFFVDIEGNLNDPGVQNACHGIKEEAVRLTILGNYTTL